MKTAAMVVLSLGLIAAPCTIAQTKHEETKEGDQSSGQRRTIQGVVAGVTVLGETMMDHESGRAITAERDYLTVVDTARHGETSSQGQQASTGEKKTEGKQDKDVKQTSGTHEGSKEAGGGSDQRSNRSAKVYLVEVTPKTEVCECQKDGKKKCELAKLEIGDRVEIEFQPWAAIPPQTHGEKLRHARHRIMRGQAVSISILRDDEHHDKGSGTSPEHSGDGNKGEPK